MRRYKPEYLGKVIPVDDDKKLTDFVQNKYDSFSKIYDACKEDSERIQDLYPLDSTEGSKELSIRVITDSDTLSSIDEKNKENSNVVISNDLITASS